MAVAVDASPNIVLDENLRIVESVCAAPYPDWRSLFLPYLEEARRARRVVTFVRYFDGIVAEVTVVPAESGLEVFWEPLCTLDVLTLEGLRASLDAARELLKTRAGAIRRDIVRSSLRVVEGGR